MKRILQKLVRVYQEHSVGFKLTYQKYGGGWSSMTVSTSMTPLVKVFTKARVEMSAFEKSFWKPYLSSGVIAWL